MKKFLILAAVCALSACACMDDNEPAEVEVVYNNIQPRPQNCDYFDGKTCYRYVRKVRQVPVVRYREPTVVSSCGCNNQSAPVVQASSSCGCSAPEVRETREPVEVVYKKTTYKTVYTPQTTASVTYEREACDGSEVVTTSNSEVVVTE